MSQEKPNLGLDVETAEAGWISLYRAAGLGALIAVGFILLDIVLSFTGGDVPVGGMNAVDWYAHLQSSWFVGLRNLGLFNVINAILTIPLYLALYQTHRKGCPAYAALALILFLLGTAIYAANNRSLSMLTLSHQYAAATTEAQKSLLVSAGTVILAQAEDFTPGTFLGFFLSSCASLLMMAVMLRGKVFSKWIALAGLIGSGSLLFFTISATFVPAIFDLAMIFAMIGGLLMVAWNISMAVGMFRMGSSSNHRDRLDKPAHRIMPAEGM